MHVAMHRAHTATRTMPILLKIEQAALQQCRGPLEHLLNIEQDREPVEHCRAHRAGTAGNASPLPVLGHQDQPASNVEKHGATENSLLTSGNRDGQSSISSQTMRWVHRWNRTRRYWHCKVLQNFWKSSQRIKECVICIASNYKQHQKPSASTIKGRVEDKYTHTITVHHYIQLHRCTRSDKCKHKRKYKEPWFTDAPRIQIQKAPNRVTAIE